MTSEGSDGQSQAKGGTGRSVCSSQSRAKGYSKSGHAHANRLEAPREQRQRGARRSILLQEACRKETQRTAWPYFFFLFSCSSQPLSLKEAQPVQIHWKLLFCSPKNLGFLKSPRIQQPPRAQAALAKGRGSNTAPGISSPEAGRRESKGNGRARGKAACSQLDPPRETREALDEFAQKACGSSTLSLLNPVSPVFALAHTKNPGQKLEQKRAGEPAGQRPATTPAACHSPQLDYERLVVP